jgi:hypothetical protein
MNRDKQSLIRPVRALVKLFMGYILPKDSLDDLYLGKKKDINTRIEVP